MAPSKGSVIAVVLLGLIAGRQTRAEQPAAETEVRALVQKFFDAYRHKDLAGFMALWSERSPDYALHRSTMERIFKETGPIELKNLDVFQVTVDKNTAQVRCRVEFVGADARTGKLHRLLGTLDRLLLLVRESGSWKVRRYLGPEQQLAERMAAATTEKERKELLAGADKLDKRQLASQIIDQVEPMLKRGRNADAAQITGIAFSLAQEMGAKEELVRCWLARTAILRAQRKYAEALEATRQALASARSAQSPEWEARALFDMGIIQHAMKQAHDALESYEAGLKLVRPLGNQALLAHGLVNLGILQSHDHDRWAAAADTLQAAAKAAREAGLRDLQKKAIYNLGMTQGRLEKYQEAATNLRLSAAMAHEDNDRSWEATARADMALAYEGLKEFPKAVDTDNAALKIFRELGDKSGQARVLKHMGRIYRRLGRYADAVEASEASDKLRREIDSESAKQKR